MNRTRETLTPSDAMKLLVATLNNPSIQHERIEIAEVYAATASLLNGKDPQPLTITKSGVVLEGLRTVLACVHAWKPALCDVARGAKGTRAYERKGPKQARTAQELSEEIDKIVNSSTRQIRVSGSA